MHIKLTAYGEMEFAALKQAALWIIHAFTFSSFAKAVAQNLTSK